MRSTRAAEAVAELGSLGHIAMSFIFELYYRSPEDKARETQIISDVVAAGGRLDFREVADRDGQPICLTFEFERREQAESVATALRERGEHVESVCDYD